MLCVQLGSDYQIILTKKENWVWEHWDKILNV